MSISNMTSTVWPDLQVPAIEHNHLPILTVALLTGIASAVYINVSSVQDPCKVGSIPTVKRPRLLDAYRSGVWWRIFVPRLVPYIEEGYHKYNKNDQPFRIWLGGFQAYAYVLPERYLDKIKNMPESEASFAAMANKYFHTGLPTGEVNNLVLQVASKLVNGNLATIKTLMQGEVQKALAREIGSPRQWTKINAWQVARKTTEAPGLRVVFGEELANDKTFVTGVSEFVSNITVYAFTLRYINLGPLRDFILYLVHWRHRRSLPAVLTPLNNVITERKKVRSNRHISDDEESFDCIQWALDQPVSDDCKTAEAIARRLVVISLGTIDTVAGVLVKQLTHLASHPECHEEIRAEIRECLAEDDNGWTLKSTGRMKKLESFIQESLRMSSGAISLSGMRIVTGSGFRLDDNTVLPRDSFIAIPTRNILYDPEVFPEPEKFDPFRFYKIKEDEKNAGSRSNRRDIRASWLAFGYGRQACPGRFYAINAMKTILGEILLKYDIRLAEKQAPRIDIDLDPMLAPVRSTDLEFRVRA
uniref:Cytochrome P450 monooxygenase sttB n=2 Tax=Aspergillus terreus (strain NIH 2624 / FGSC A1156) TaxID=341663 RepID=STTB_ASPTN|nr:RecName: Full=Cytochrome P450 monooxygenase sttB; AltName: Full=Aspterpenacid biosynthesis cluster protein sttB; AltName: Full=Ophiobolin family sesterterpenoid biosynthesis cluster protein B [Aspergillus terreus NIH2624]